MEPVGREGIASCRTRCSKCRRCRWRRRAAISSLDVSLRVDLEAIAPSYSWVVVALSSRMAAGQTGNVALRNIRESLRVLTVLAACNGFSLTQNPKFWSEVWPDDRTSEHQQPQWAAKWKHLHLRGRPTPSDDTLRFLLAVEDAEFGGRHHDAIALVEELIQVKEAQESDSPGLRLTMEILSRHVEDDKWPMCVVCGMDCPHGDANRWSRLFSEPKDRTRKRMTKMGIPFRVAECFMSAHHCVERSGTLREVAAVIQTDGCVVPVKELKLHFGWNTTERHLSKRLREFRALMWNLANVREEAAQIRVLHLTGRRLCDVFFFSTICSALPFTESLEELRLALPPVVHNDTRKLLWRWLAVSVFHPQSKSKLQHLDLSQCNVSAEDVEVVSDVLNREWRSVMLQLLTYSPNSQAVSLAQAETTLALVKSNARIEAEPCYTSEKNGYVCTCRALDVDLSSANPSHLSRRVQALYLPQKRSSPL
ncbi:hypothetical protein PHYPSEUDO_008624 [Phytophthora pseudosyringae]|uniref:Uncharacterized protein n=1 Tax=Phytophthora pseudosyringae TaxID=221518 RepID=A0A8T1WDA1_9STRA|nr:hypothetical protein PHYPSEUDO_008624 [Phytophthora pseudosyringae]